MKIRNGFVSNSSSSSFVAVIPRNLDVDKAAKDSITALIKIGELGPKHISKKYLTSNNKEISIDKMRKEVLETLPGGGRWHGYDYDLYCVIKHMLEKYFIASFETGPNGGEIVFLKQSQVENMLKKFNEEQ